MKRGLKTKLIATVAAILSLIFVMGIFAGAGESEINRFDFGNPNAQNNQTVKPSALFESAFPSLNLSATEKTFLDDLSGITFQYNDSIPIDVVKPSYDRKTGTLTVTATPYSYVASNGLTVEWRPKSATLEGKTETFDESGKCSFSGLLHTADFDLQVIFSWSVKLDAQTADTLLNAAYREGKRAEGILDEYLAELSKYNAAMEKYNAHQAYLQLEKDFAAYQAAMKVYDADMQVWLAYKAEHAVWEAEYAKYESWQKFFAYDDFQKNNLEAYKNYLLYKQDVEKVEERLEILEKLFVTDSRGWQFYGSLLGDTVKQVVDRKAELVTAGCNAKDIDTAGDATTKLRALMKGYYELRRAKYPSEHEKIAALYAYYTQNYDALGLQFRRLYTALNSLCRNPLVGQAMETEGKLEHFKQFIGQMYIATTCLDDSVMRDPNWTFYKDKLEKAVEPCQMMPDLKSHPSGATMPDVEVPAVEYVEKVERPAGDPVYYAPVEPTFVAEPKKPVTVTDPSTVQKPEAAEKPDWSMPTEPPMPAASKALADMVRKGSLKERNAATYLRATAFETSLTRPISIDNKKIIVFYDSDGKTVLDRQTVENGTRFTYNGKDISKWEDDACKYTFAYWMLADGTNPELIATDDLSLYAKYWTEKRFYTVTWILDGRTERQTYAYGTLPTCPFVTNPAPDQGYTYEFSGWDQEVAPVTGNVTYTGSITAIPKMFNITWIMGDRTVTEQYPYGSVPDYTGNKEYASPYYRYEFLTWRKVVNGQDSGFLTSVVEDTTYRAQYRETPLAVTDSGEQMRVEATDTAMIVKCTANRIDFWEAAKSAEAAGKDLVLDYGSFSFTLTGETLESLFAIGCRKIDLDFPTDGNGAFLLRLRNSQNMLISARGLQYTFRAGTDAEGNPTVAYYQQNDAWTVVPAEGLELTDVPVFRVASTYAIGFTAIGDGMPNLSGVARMLEAGTRFDLSKIPCTFGYEISAARVVCADGSLVALDGLTFTMPDQAVAIELTISRIVYHVTFVVDGVVVSEKDYYLGDEIEKPTVPTKASDEKFHYTFIGWSQNVTVAMGDDRTPTYEAVFSTTPITVGDPYASGHNNNVFLTVVLPIAGGVFVIGVAGVILLLRRRKKKKAASEDTAEVTE